MASAEPRDPARTDANKPRPQSQVGGATTYTPPLRLPTAHLAIPWRQIILAVIGLRVLITLLGAGMVLLLPRAGQGHGLQALLLDPWRHFDALWFTQIAAHGYSATNGTTAYQPIYPLLIRIASLLTGGHMLTAALLVSNLGLVAATGLIWRWVAGRFDRGVAWRTVILILLYPDAFFLLGAYSESTFLALAAGALLASDRERPLLAGTLALLASVTRLQGLVLIVPLAFAAWRRRHDRRAALLGLAGALLPLAGYALYQRALTAVLGGGGILSTYSSQWHIPLQFPWQTIWEYVTVIHSPQWHLFHSPRYNYILLWYLLIALFSLAVLLLSWRRLGTDLALFGLAGWCFLMTRWYSTGRYILAVLPFFIALALWADSRRRLRWLVTPSLLLLAFYVAEFAQNSWVD